MNNLSFGLLLFCCMSCNDSKKNCFYITTYPEFKMGEIVDTTRIPFDLKPFDTNDIEMKDLLSYSHAYMCFAFNGGISTLMFTLDDADQKLNSITAMWTIMGEPESFLNRLRDSYLPCIPIETLLNHPNTPVVDRGNGNPEFYKYSNTYSGGISSLHYWVGIEY